MLVTKMKSLNFCIDILRIGYKTVEKHVTITLFSLNFQFGSDYFFGPLWDLNVPRSKQTYTLKDY